MAEKNEMHEHANDLLSSIRALMGSLERVQADADAAAKKVMAGYAFRAQLIKDGLTDKQKELLAFMKENRQNLFGEGDLVDLTNGVLLYSKGLKVSIPRDALAKAEEQGFTEVIKIEKSLDREAVEKWPDERLFLIGAQRKPAEEYAYEVKDATGAKRPKAKLGGKKKGK